MSGSSFAIVWEWQLPLRTHIWVPYTTNVCQHIEKEFRNSPSQAASLNGLNVMELTDCEIDFARMRQVNTVTSKLGALYFILYRSCLNEVLGFFKAKNFEICYFRILISQNFYTCHFPGIVSKPIFYFYKTSLTK